MNRRKLLPLMLAGILAASPAGADPLTVPRFYEASEKDSQANSSCPRMSALVATDLLERPLGTSAVNIADHSAKVPVGPNQIVTLHIVSRSDGPDSINLRLLADFAGSPIQNNVRPA